MPMVPSAPPAAREPVSPINTLAGATRSAIAVTAPDADSAALVAAELGGEDTVVLGPVPVEGGHRVLVMTTTRVPTVAVLAALRTRLSHENVALSVDVDPVDLA